MMNRENQIKDIGFVLTKAPIESSLTYRFLSLAQNVVDKDKTIGLFLISDGVWLAKKNQNNKPHELLNKLLKNGAEVTVSKDHLMAAGIEDSDLINGVNVTEQPYVDLVDHVMEKWNKVITI